MLKQIRKCNEAIRYVLKSPVLKRNLTLAIIVGLLLSFANQLDVVLSQPFTFKIGLKMLFNFVIPFTVSSISAALNRLG
jgi:hypothetical protein